MYIAIPRHSLTQTPCC